MRDDASYMTGICTTTQRPRLGRDGSTGGLPGQLSQNDLILTHAAPSWAKLNPGGRESTILTVRMFMSDDNYRKPSSPRSTQIGLGLIGTDGSYDRRPNETLSGRSAPFEQREYRSLTDSDDRYMDPPSETDGVERDELVRRLNEESAAHARPVAPSYRPVQTPGQGLFGSTLRAHTSQPRVAPEREAQRYSLSQESIESGDAGNVGLFQGALDHTLQAQPVAAATRPPPPPAPTGRGAAPEAWRDEVRRMVERAPTNRPGPTAPSAPSAPGPQQPTGPSGPSGLGGFGGPTGPSGPGIPGSSKPSLRLKLDADAVEESYRAPKSGLPKLMVWLVILGLIGAGFAYFAQSQGGVAALIKRFGTAQPTLITQDPQPPSAAAPSAPTVDPNAAVQQPPAAASPGAAPTQPPPTAAPSAPQPASATAPAAPPQTAAKPAEPAAVAKPQPEAPKAAEQPAAKPAAAKPVAPKPRPVRPQQPVVKVRPIESAPSAPDTTAPPTPDHPDIPYVPMPGDPPAPDEPR
jgi:hypothetical protein